MNKYLISIKRKSSAFMIVGYDEAGALASVAIETRGLSLEQLIFLRDIVPVSEKTIQSILAPIAGAKYELVPQDLSFNAFWDAYAYKVGKRDRAQNLWLALPEADRIKCLRAIPLYTQWLATKSNMERLYPETFLSQRQFDNEFRV